MISWLGTAAGWLFGGSKTSNNLISDASSGIDKLFYTDEEKAEGRQASFKLWIEYQKATAPQNIARRLIALIVTSVWSTLVISAGALHISGLEDQAAYLLKLLDDGGVSMAFMVVIGFYFAKRMLGANK